MSQLKWAAFAVIVVGLLTLVSGYLFVAALGDNQDAASADSGSPLARENSTSPVNDGPNAEPEEDATKPINPEAKPATPVRRDSLILKQLTVPPENKSDDHHLHTLCLDANGRRLVATSQTATWCFDLTTGKILQTYRYEMSATRPGLLPFIAASPDARFLVIPSGDGKELTLREAATARLIGTYRLNAKSKFFEFLLNSGLPAFTPAEDFLLVGAGTVTLTELHAFSTQTGTEKLVDVPRIDLSKKMFNYMLPVPQSTTFLVYGSAYVDRSNPSNLFAVDFTTGKETPLTSLHIGPQVHGNRSMVLSPDGSLLLVSNIGTMEICNWRTNRLVFRHTEGSSNFVDACFTPDGKRVAVLWHWNSKNIMFGVDPKTGKSWHYDDEVRLYDIARQEKIGSFTPHNYGLDSHVRALALSHDGKSFAVWTGSDITLIDFQSAFGVDPLPPSPRLQGPESLPLKPLADGKEPPRKPK